MLEVNCSNPKGHTKFEKEVFLYQQTLRSDKGIEGRRH